VNAAIPIGLTKVRSSPLFSFIPATETHITEVFELFDEIDAWLESELPEATTWIKLRLDVRFDEIFRPLLAQAREAATSVGPAADPFTGWGLSLALHRP
jgi:hypothetical protein